MNEYQTINNFLSEEDLLICQTYFQNNIVEESWDVLIDGESWNDNSNIIYVNLENEIDGFDVEDEYILQLFSKYNDKLAKTLDKNYNNVRIEFIMSSSKLKWLISDDDKNLLRATIYANTDESADTQENTCVYFINDLD
jgi:hypothetical protein